MVCRLMTLNASSVLARLDPRPRVIAFDAYGTLFDVHSAVQALGGRMGPDAAAFSALWRAKQLEYTWVLSLAGQYRDFWLLTQDALGFALASFPSVDPALRSELLAAYRTLSAYPDAAGALGRIKAAGLDTCILSNGEPGMLADAVSSAGLGPLLDDVVSVDAARVFKTSPPAYRLVCDRFGAEPREIMLVSSNRWDAAGAAAFGFRTIWVNRMGMPAEYDDHPPDAVLRSLEEVA